MAPYISVTCSVHQISSIDTNAFEIVTIRLRIARNICFETKMSNAINPLATWNLSNLFHTGLLVDINFIVKTKIGTETRIAAHKNILASLSPVFERMFCGDLKASDNVNITDVTAEGFTEFLQIFYLSDVRFTDANIGEVLKLLDKYDIQGGVSIIERYMERSMDKGNVLLYYQLSLSFALSQKVTDLCVEIICSNIEEVLNTSGLFCLEETTLIQLLSMDQISCDEMVIFRAAMKWAEHILGIKGLNVTIDNMRGVLDDVIHCIRFPTMPIESFLSILG